MSSGSEIIGVILAAGRGSRMFPFSERLPKPILPILNRPLLAYQLDSMKRVGIKKVIIVVGHYGFEIVRAIGDGSEWGMSIDYVDQERTLGIAHALGCLEPRIDNPFLLFLGDIFFTVSDVEALVGPVVEGRANAVLAAKRERDPEAIRKNFAIIQRPDGSVERVIEKPRYVKTDLKGCGLYTFDQHIFDAVRRTPRTAARDEYEITDSIQLLIDDGFQVEVMDGVAQDVNLTQPEDLLTANRLELSNRGLERLVGSDFQGPPEANIRRSVVGDGVRAPRSIVISDSVIFKGVVIGEDRDLDRVIATPERLLSVDGG